jgi:hypothetical protein
VGELPAQALISRLRPDRCSRGGLKTAGGAIPLLLLVALVSAWAALGAWLIPRYPFLGGTDEALEYPAFAAAKNRWPTDAEIRRYRLSTAYHPPLYFLAAATFWGDDPLFTDDFPALTQVDTFSYGGYRCLYPGFDPIRHATLDRLYRAMKYFSLGLGVVTLFAVAATVRVTLPNPDGWWIVLLAVVPLAALPQFLYYQTLLNSDALCNALSALAILCFAGAAAAISRGDARAHVAWACGMACFLGLNVLTKTTALVLLPLIPWTALGAFFGPQRQPKAAWSRFFRILGLMTVVMVVSGGWWIARNAWRGDWNGLQLTRSVSPWAFSTHPDWERHGWLNFLLATARSAVGLMTGSYWGVSDMTFIAYSIGPMLTILLGVGLIGYWVRLPRTGHGHWLQPTPRRWLLAGLVLAVVSNVAGFLWLNREAPAPFGRLLFPSLAAIHALAAHAWWALLKRRRRTLIVVTALAALLYGAAFTYVFRGWMLRAVEQPEEHVVSLAMPPAVLLNEPICGHEYRQPLVLPPGRVGALRVKLAVTDAWPRLGGRITGSLDIVDEHGESRQVPLEPIGLGDLGWGDRYLELPLSQPVAVARESSAVLTLRPERPVFPATSPVRMLGCRAGAGPFIGDVTRDGVALGGENLCLAVVYGE